MNTSTLTKNSRTLPFTSLSAIRNAGTRIYVAGSDPLFGARRRTDFGTELTSRLWAPSVLDRLQVPLSRVHE